MNDDDLAFYGGYGRSKSLQDLPWDTDIFWLRYNIVDLWRVLGEVIDRLPLDVTPPRRLDIPTERKRMQELKDQIQELKNG